MKSEKLLENKNIQVGGSITGHHSSSPTISNVEENLRLINMHPSATEMRLWQFSP